MANDDRKKKLKPWEKAWVNPKFVFKNPRCLKSRIPAAPNCAYDEAMKSDSSSEEEQPNPNSPPKLDQVAMPKPKVKQPKQKPFTNRESLKEWKQRRKRFVKKEEPRDVHFPTRIGFAYSDLPMDPKREEDRILIVPSGMSRAERRHWEAWANN